jgi:hypothetical protein
MHPAEAKRPRVKEYRMGTAFYIIVADVLLFVFYICQYRQELGLMVEGSHDEPVRRPPAKKPPPAPPSGSRQIVVKP